MTPSRILTGVLIVMCIWGTSAEARPIHRHRHVIRRVKPNPCAGLPTQTVSLIDETGRALDFSHVRHALIDQSLRLRAAWNTPCVRFAPGGWPIYVQTGEQRQPDGSIVAATSGEHYGPGHGHPTPWAIVHTGDLPVSDARALSHELDEMLADPYLITTWHFGAIGGRLEICDPAENFTIALDGITLTDFALRSNFDGGAWPYDAAHALTAPSYRGAS